MRTCKPRLRLHMAEQLASIQCCNLIIEASPSLVNLIRVAHSTAEVACATCLQVPGTLSTPVRVTWRAEHLCRSAWSRQTEGLTCMLPGPCKTVQWGDPAFTVPLWELCLHSAYTLVPASSAFCAFLDVSGSGDVVCPKGSVRISARRPLPDLTRRPPIMR